MDDPTSPPAAPANDPAAGGRRPPGYDVFVSHSSKDKAAADTVCHALEACHIRCWIAPRDIRPGSNWGEAILEAISSVRVMVLILSANANSSPQIQREVERAVHHGVIIIPMRIEEVIPARSLEYFLSTSHWLDAFSPPLKQHLAHLADTIQGVLGQERTNPSAMDAPVAARSRLAPRVAALAVVLALAALAGWWWQTRQTAKPAASTGTAPAATDHSVVAVAPTPAPTAAPTVLPTAAPVVIASATPVATPTAAPAPSNPPVFLKPLPVPDEASQKRDAYLRAREVDQQLNAAWKSLYNHPRLRSANRDQLLKIENQWLSRRSAQTGGPELLSRYEHGKSTSVEHFYRFIQMDIEQTEWLRAESSSLR